MNKIRLKYIVIICVSFTLMCGCINYTSTNAKIVERDNIEVEIKDKKEETHMVSIPGYVDFRSGKRPLQNIDQKDGVKDKYIQNKNLNNNSNAISDDSNLQKIKYIGYEVLFNSSTKIPVWVKYELTSEEADGVYSRRGKDFRQDLTVKANQADDYDYRGSGWSRGHMAPAADFKWSNEAMWDTFYYTNCCPQNQSLNSGQWNTLEQKVRDWAKRFGCVTVVAGPIIWNNEHGTIGNNVVVPDAFYKAINNGEQAIGFVMYNRSKNENMQKCALSIDSLEVLSGLDFFSELDDVIEENIEGTYSLKYWGL